ncbi:MAG: 3-oxoacyl-ACP reductase family protein [Oscillospiraceae bacterium]
MLNGKIAIVTGGTRGIGFAIVKKFLANNATVILCGSKKETADKAVEAILSENPNAKVAGICPNLSDIKEVEKAFARVNEEYGKIDILVNNAGISQRESIYDYDAEDFKKIMDLNVTAVFNCAKAVAPIMRSQGGGVILNNSSMVSIYGQKSGCGYPTSKFAVNGLTKSLARELARDKIRVNAVAPGVVDTDMVAALPNDMREKLIATLPLGRMATPEDIANAFLFLAGDMASYISGIVLSVDGLAVN